MNADQPERPVQQFTDDYLLRCRSLSPADIVRFLDNFRVVAAAGAAERNANRSPKSVHVAKDLRGALSTAMSRPVSNRRSNPG